MRIYRIGSEETVKVTNENVNDIMDYLLSRNFKTMSDKTKYINGTYTLDLYLLLNYIFHGCGVDNKKMFNADKLKRLYEKYIKGKKELDDMKKSYIRIMKVILIGKEKLQFMKEFGEIMKDPEESKVESIGSEMGVEDMLK